MYFLIQMHVEIGHSELALLKARFNVSAKFSLGHYHVMFGFSELGDISRVSIYFN